MLKTSVSLFIIIKMRGSRFIIAPATIATIGFFLAAVFGIRAQESEPREKGVVAQVGQLEVVRTQDIPEVKEAIEKARPVEPSAVPTPKFTIRTRDNKFMLTIGGKIDPILGYDIGNNLYSTDAGISFVTGDIPVPALDGHKGDFFINPLNSKIDFTVVGFSGSNNEITGYFRIGTNGKSHGVTLSRAYLTWRNVTVGQKTTVAQDEYATSVPTIDPQGPNGIISTVNYQISYRSPSYNGFRFAASLEMPTYYASNGVYLGHDYMSWYGHKVESEVDQFIPDIPLWVEYGKSEANRIRLTGLLRTFAYQDMIEKQRRHILGWGAMLSGNFSFYKPLQFYFQAVYGQGIGNYLQDIAGRPLSFTPKSSRPGHMEANPMMGLMFGASYKVTPRLSFNAVGSYSRIWNVGNYATIGDAVVADANGDNVLTAGDANYHCAVYAAVNCFYKITNYLQWGIEYLYGRRYTYTLGGANDSRIETQLSLTF